MSTTPQLPTVHIGADHRGFELKEHLKSWLQVQGYSVIDQGNAVFDPVDDYPIFGQKVAQAVASDDSKAARGIVICGSGVGVTVIANKVKGVRAGLALNQDQVVSATSHDAVNVLGLASEYLQLEEAQTLVSAFLTAVPDTSPQYQRRQSQIEDYEQHPLSALS